MTATVTVCIGTYGDLGRWGSLAVHRAHRSASNQTRRPAQVLWSHQADLALARNAAAGDARSDWLCFLDADDQLDPGYIAAMARTAAQMTGPALIQPATLGVHADGHEDPYPVMIPAKPLLDGNYLIIGTLIRCDQFQRLGGFRDLPMYEDWDLWIRAHLDGARIVQCPEAVYRVQVNPAGRNSASRDQQIAVYNQIRQRYLHARRAS